MAQLCRYKYCNTDYTDSLSLLKKIFVIRAICVLSFLKSANDYFLFAKVVSIDWIIRSLVQFPDTIMRRMV